jgi:hypothetical protein
LIKYQIYHFCLSLIFLKSKEVNVKLKKKFLVPLLSFCLIVGVAAGIFIAEYFWETSMTMQLVADPYEAYGLQLEYEDGTPITDYDWGNFIPGETKSFNVSLHYLGTIPGNVTWNTTNLPAGWSIAVWSWEVAPGSPEVPPILWPANGVGTLPPGWLGTIQIDLTEISAIEYQPYSFTLTWWSGPP